MRIRKRRACTLRQEASTLAAGKSLSSVLCDPSEELSLIDSSEDQFQTVLLLRYILQMLHYKQTFLSILTGEKLTAKGSQRHGSLRSDDSKVKFLQIYPLILEVVFDFIVPNISEHQHSALPCF